MMQPQQFREYTLPDVIESDITLVLNLTDAIVTLLVSGELTAQHICTDEEITALFTLLEAHPTPCTSAALYAALTRVSPTDAHDFLEVVGEDYLDIAMQPVRAVLKRCRAILATCNLGIQPTKEAAYTLFRLEVRTVTPVGNNRGGVNMMRPDEDEPIYMLHNVRGAITRHIARCTPEQLAPAGRAELVRHFATSDPAMTYMAMHRLHIDTLTALVDEVIAEQTKGG